MTKRTWEALGKPDTIPSLGQIGLVVLIICVI
jgi:hypothetical protein